MVQWALSQLPAEEPLRSEEPLRLRVLTYNIHHGEGVDGRLDLVRIAKVIQEVDPDIAALQEVDQNAGRSGQVDQAAELGRLTKMRSVFGGNIELQGGKYGNALLTRFEIIKQQIDFILVRPSGQWKTVETKVLDEEIASDHRPFFAIIELK